MSTKTKYLTIVFCGVTQLYCLPGYKYTNEWRRHELITYRDHRIMRRVNQWRPPRWVRWWALWATRAGDGWLW